ncbi:MAG: serine hydrolase domain-containing protein, partial [Ilumatobacteraceae bacterium]
MYRHRSTASLRLAAVGAVVGLALAACSSDGDDAAPAAPDTTEAPPAAPETTEAAAADTTVEDPAEEPAPAGPPGNPAQTVTRADVDAALEKIPDTVEAMREETGVPGLSIAVVFEDEVVYAEGFGVRELGSDEAVGADTVFQVASLSKPISATAVAGIVGDGTIAWDDAIV